MPKAQPEGKKVLIRRLPPGMTADECLAILGNEWAVGNGKVDWARYDDGEITDDLADSSRPARYYLHLISPNDILALSEKVQQSKWEDARHTANDPALVGPPYMEIATFQKIPTGKKRTDPRQGTIDSEPEFMKFLESLTAPTPTKEADPEQLTEDSNKTEPKVTSTPLVEYIKEKKAIKAKEAALAKSAKHARHESQPKGKEDTKKKGKESKADKTERPPEKEKEKEKPKEPIKLLTKKAVAQEVAEAAKIAATQATSNKVSEEAAPKSRRANIAAAAKILQRDLGLSPGSAHRRARQDAAKDAAKVDGTSKPETNKDNKETNGKPITSVPPTGPSKSNSTTAPPPSPAPKAQPSEGSRRTRSGKGTKQTSIGENGKGKGPETLTTGKSAPMPTPVILKRKENPASTEAAPSTAPSTSAAATTPAPATPAGPKATAPKATPAGKSVAASQKKASAVSSVTPGATRGFVKHANPSQGVTETLLKQAMEVFGPVTFVEIDKRKGFAYVDFGSHDGLVKAVAASPVSVAQGTVQVLERKEAKKAAAVAAPPAQPAAEKKAELPADRSKRGGRGRGRRGANSNTAGGAADSPGPSTAQNGVATSTAADGG
ncbi:putative regulator of nonsense transcripts 3A [Rosellinia necatrix]|uniref:Putative regulator of nonsense transcripts 3A n=1 Tax=Rosellinia necatrix TaxID=77044 RepID=A0A1S7UKT2_ROSNE|nr:putative regulator of nonsense transcripts 3A [Rosellinia necatrix]